MILEEETFEAFGYYPSKLKLHSGKLVITSCTMCGNFRITQKQHYRRFCVSCNIVLKKLSKNTLKNKEEKKGLIRNQREKNKNGGKYKKLTLKQKERTKRVNTKRKNGMKIMQKRIEKAIVHTHFYETDTKYCHLFNEEYKRKIRERYGNSCFLCGKWAIDDGRALDVHHVFYNKNCGCNGIKCVCVPLCRSCHSKTNHNREKWASYILELLGIE